MAGDMRLIPVTGLPAVQPGDDLAELVLAHLHEPVHDGDVFVIAQKIVSRAENRLRFLPDVRPSARALALAPEAQKDARLVEVILADSTEVLRLRQGVFIVEQRNGFVCANAGVDRSNVPPGNGQMVALLPVDADASADRFVEGVLRHTQRTVGAIVNDSHGRAWREGSVGVAIGVSGLPALKDERGRHDLYGYELQTSIIGWADEVASEASLLMGQSDQGVPVVLIRGLERPAGPNGSFRDLLRPKQKDLFR